MEQLESRKISMRYAKALLEAAQEQGTTEAVSDNLRQLQRLYADVPEMNQFFSNPGIPQDEKQQIVDKQFKKGLAPLVGNFLQLLLENNRIDLLQEIVEATIDLLNKQAGIAHAEVTVPVAIDAKLEKKLRTNLEQLFGYQQVEMTLIVDPAIIAGAIVKIGDKIIDGSYHGKLEMLRRQAG